MRLVLEDDAFASVNELDITSLVQKALRKRCYLGVRNEDGHHFTRWKANAPRNLVAALSTVTQWDLLDATAFRTRRVLVGAENANSWFSQPPRVSIVLAIDLLETPFRVIMENGRFDRAFLLSMCDDETYRLLTQMEEDRRLVFVGGGGIDELRELVNETFSREQVRHLRCWAMFDSDAASPDAPSEAAQSTADACENAEIAHYMLRRRAIENYLPDGAFSVWAYRSTNSRTERVKKLAAIKRLTPNQRSHLHMKYGLPSNPNQDEVELFRSLSEGDRSVLANGVGKKVADLFREVPRGKLRHYITTDGVDAELAAPIAQLVEMLRVPNG